MAATETPLLGCGFESETRCDRNGGEKQDGGIGRSDNQKRKEEFREE